MRTSDQRRERVVRLLGRGYSEGYLSTDTFEARAGDALGSQDDRELHALVDDLPAARPWAAALAGARRRIADAFGAARISEPVLVPEPPHDAAAGGLVIGRNPDCDLVVDDPTVSRRHAELRREDGCWILVDLGSSNGTRVNGWRIERATVGVGDELALGSQRLVLSRPKSAAPWWAAPERPAR